MESIGIYGPRPRRDVQHQAAAERECITETRSAAELHYRASTALADVDTLVRAADAAQRAGSWQPGAAANWHDFNLLADAEDVLQRRRQR